jgi:hypothetical protein
MLPVKILLVPGTWGTVRAWWHPTAPLPRLLEEAGHEVLSPLATSDAWSWRTPLDGVFGANDAWEEAGLSLYWYLESHHVDAMLTHSHGIQPVAIALAHGRTIRTLVSVAGPVRRELADRYRAAREAATWWTQIHTDPWGDWWQGLGGRSLHYAQPAADRNVYEPGRLCWRGHTGLLDADLWAARGWARCLDG